jgi:site-specific recombinase XerD
MKKYLETRLDENDILFASKKSPHNGIQKEAIEKIVKRIGERIGIHSYPHRCRHRFGTFGIQSGMPLEMLQALMGHSKPETTLIYAKMDQTDIQREHRRHYA